MSVMNFFSSRKKATQPTNQNKLKKYLLSYKDLDRFDTLRDKYNKVQEEIKHTFFLELDKTICNEQCPYCCYKLEKLPKRKTKCKSCGNFIFVRNSIPITQYNKFKLDALLSYGVLKDEYDDLKFHPDVSDCLESKGESKSIKELVCYLFQLLKNRINLIVIELEVEKKSFNKLSESELDKYIEYIEFVSKCYGDLAKLLYDSRDEINYMPEVPYGYEVEMNKWILKRLKVYGYDKASIMACGFEGCKCNKDEGKEFLISDMLDMPVLPHKSCEGERGCMCSYN